jgi:prepilin-type N-terminal cleavage/methylation domain-containing protein
MRTQRTHNRGFTLIETMVYLALYAIIVTGALAAAYSIFESSARNQAQAMVQEEGSYLIGKVDWTVTNVTSIQSPAAGPLGGTILTVTKFDGSTVSIQQSGNDLQISENGNPFQKLNNTNIGVSGVTFIHTSPSADGINPQSIYASITVNATTSDGHVYSRDFSTIKYLRK